MNRKKQIARIIHELHEARAYLICAYELADTTPTDIERTQDYNTNLAAAEGNLETASSHFANIKLYQPQQH